MADKLTAGAGDSISSKADAKEILDALNDGNTYKDIEKSNDEIFAWKLQLDWCCRRMV